MEQIQAQMEQLQVNGANAGKLLHQLGVTLEAIRVGKMGGVRPDATWVPPVAASTLVVWESKRVSLNAKRRVGDQVDRVLLEIAKLQQAITTSQHASYKHVFNKRLRAEADADAATDAKERQARQDFLAQDAVKRSEAASNRKKRKVVLDNFNDDEEADLR
jgi:hypothetical protein